MSQNRPAAAPPIKLPNRGEFVETSEPKATEEPAPAASEIPPVEPEQAEDESTPSAPRKGGLPGFHELMSHPSRYGRAAHDIAFAWNTGTVDPAVAKYLERCLPAHCVRLCEELALERIEDPALSAREWLPIYVERTGKPKS